MSAEAKPAAVRLLAAFLLLAVALGGCGSSTEPAGNQTFGRSPFANVDPANTRNAASSLEAANVSDLGLAWSQPVPGSGDGVDFIASPVVAHGLAYLQDQNSNVRAIDVASGQTVWEKHYEMAADGPNGVIVASGLVFGATPTTAFALDASSGKVVWTVRLVRSDAEQIAMAPGFHDGLVYISTRPHDEEGGEVGVLWALGAKSGKKIWHFDTVPEGLWGNPEINFGGGLTHPPAFDGEGSVYIGTGNAGPIPGTDRFPWGLSRPGPNLYTDSVVKLDEKTGKVDWAYQLTPHGLCNWGLGAPILTRSPGRKLVIAAGYSGVVIALDRRTGKPVWRQPVGRHNGHDNDGLVAMRGEYGRLPLPMTVYPGQFGGAGGPMALHGSTLFVPVVNSATRLESQVGGAREVGEDSGELVALDVATGKVKWKRSSPTPLYGPVLATNDLVFSTSFEGTVHAFNAATGAEAWSEKLPSYAEGGLTAAGDTLLVRSGFPAEEGAGKLTAYRLGN